MKEHITIDLPENHAVDILAREIVKLKDKVEEIHYCMADGDEFGELTKNLEETQKKLSDCQDAIKYIYSEIME